MSAGIILTQLPGVWERCALEALGDSGGELECYSAAEGAPSAAVVQYFDSDVQNAKLGAMPVCDDLSTRFVARLLSDTGPVDISGPILMIVAFDVPDDAVAEVERWYAEEHIPMLMRAPGWLRARRYQTISLAGAKRFTSIALHELRELEVLGSEERRLARSTDWRARLEQNLWFQQAGRFVYRRMAKAE